VLALVMQGSDEFSDLMLQTKLSKTALANHLKHLMRMGLVKRIARGKYSLTVDFCEKARGAEKSPAQPLHQESDRRKNLE